MNFHTKVLAPFAASDGLKLSLKVEVKPSKGIPKAKVEQVRVSLRDLGMTEDLEEADGN